MFQVFFLDTVCSRVQPTLSPIKTVFFILWLQLNGFVLRNHIYNLLLQTCIVASVYSCCLISPSSLQESLLFVKFSFLSFFYWIEEGWNLPMLCALVSLVRHLHRVLHFLFHRKIANGILTAKTTTTKKCSFYIKHYIFLLTLYSPALVKTSYSSLMYVAASQRIIPCERWSFYGGINIA